MKTKLLPVALGAVCLVAGFGLYQLGLHQGMKEAGPAPEQSSASNAMPHAGAG